MMQQHFEGLKVWQVSMDLAEEIYKATKDFPREEQYGLVSQLRRAASSIPANIAEGKGRNSKKEYTQFLYMSRGSTFEVMTFIQLSERLKYLPSSKADHLQSLLNETSAMLTGLIRSLQ